MLNLLNSQNDKPRSSARVVDGKLILSFPTAIAPVVWQMDLGHAKASALEVVAEDEGGIFSLTLKTPKGEQIKVASFVNKAEAVSGLMAASSALQSAHGKIFVGAEGAAKAGAAAQSSGGGAVFAPVNDRGRPGGKLVSGLLALLMLGVLITIWVSIIPRPPANFDSIEGRGTAQGESAGTTSMAAPEPGVPVSADAYLSGQ